MDPSSNNDQYLVRNKEEGGDDKMNNCWTRDDGDWFLNKARKDFPNEGRDLCDMIKAMHAWEPLKKEGELKRNKRRNSKP